jgi:hypothetical protein
VSFVVEGVVVVIVATTLDVVAGGVVGVIVIIDIDVVDVVKDMVVKVISLPLTVLEVVASARK